MSVLLTWRPKYEKCVFGNATATTHINGDDNATDETDDKMMIMESQLWIKWSQWTLT